ncbi:1,4-dihydroxy-2-naphthoate octaprenyltransferase [Aquaticitalea lipolytica]|uniref:1,4-dihydroxy-2-naphthoate octaprenyltransferase n=1 Tax=Aquaticitalea lipolytica TaxID=1247562 RepID=UPI0032180BC2
MIKDIKPWLSAFRLRTLPLSVSGIILGSCFAFYNGFFNWIVFLLAILTTIALQILSNLANDLGDSEKGTDNEHRVGPERAVQSGKITSDQMFEAIKMNIIIVIILAFLLVYCAFGVRHFLYAVLFLALAGISIYSAVSYTMGNSAYGYKGLGDLFVLIFFGFVSVVGTYFLHTMQLDHVLVLPALTLGLLSVGVLNLNNMRDIDSDKMSNKMTLAVKMGKKGAKIYHVILIAGAIIISLVFSILYYTTLWNFLFLVTYIPLILHLKLIIKAKQPNDFDAQLKVLALTAFVFSLLLGIGYIL